jgi:hypothetical protein
MKKQLFFLTAIMLTICFGCSKDSETPAGIADNAVGVYSGSWSINSMNVSGTCDVVKVTGTSVDLKMTAGGQSLPTLPKVALSDGGNGKIKLSYSDPSGSLSGIIQDNSISFTLKAGTITETFLGSK